MYSIEFLRTDVRLSPSKYHREYSPEGSYCLFQFERSGVIQHVHEFISDHQSTNILTQSINIKKNICD